MKKWFFLFLGLVVLVLPGFSRAEEDENAKEPVLTMEKMVVTATRTPSTLEKIGGSSVTVIDIEDIEAKQQITVEEVLKDVPGIDVVANGGLGAQSSVFIRGADSKNTLILVDGIIFNDSSGISRSADLANLTADNIERIEVVRGPLSVLYGSNATAGVINIITRKGEGKPSVYAGFEGGSYSTWKAYGGASGALDKFNFSLSASRTETDGFSIANDDNDKIPHAGNTSEDDGWENTTLSGKFGYDITPDFDISAVVRYLDSEVDEDDYGFGSGYTGDRFNTDPLTWADIPDPAGKKDRRTESDQIFGKFNIHNYFFDGFFESTLSYQVSDQERDAYNNDGGNFYDYEGKTQEISWQGGLNFNDTNMLSFGATYFEEEMESDSSNIDKKDTDTTSFWVQDQLFLGDGLDIVAGLRYDDHDQFGNKTTYRLAPAYTIEKTQTTFKASYGTGFRAPSLFELYSVYGNEDLDPEESEGWDVGFEQGLLNKKVKLGLTYFDMVFDDRIDYDFEISKYNQLEGETKTRGIEAFVQWTPSSDLDFVLNYTYNDTEDPDGKRLVRRPLNKIYFNARYRLFEKALINLDIYWVDERAAGSFAMDKNGNSVSTLDDYTRVNVSANYDLNDFIQIYGRIDNLFDEEYEEAWSYATPGVSGYAGIKFRY